MSDNNAAINIFVSFLLLALIYLIIMIYSGKRMISLILQRNQKIFLGIFFYLTVTLVSLLRLLSSVAMTVIVATSSKLSNTTKQNRNVLVLLYLPNMIIWITYGLLFWEFMKQFKECHLNLNYRRVDTLQDKRVYLICLIGYAFVHILFISLLQAEIISESGFILENLIMNFSIPVMGSLIIFIIHFKYSGLPKKSLYYEILFNKTKRIIFLWSLARLFEGTFDLLMYKYEDLVFFNIFQEDPSGTDEVLVIVYIFILIAVNIIAEILPFLLILSKSYLNIYTGAARHINNNNDDLSCYLIQSSEQVNSVGNLKRSNNLTKAINSEKEETEAPSLKDEISFEIQNLNFEENLVLERSGGLGTLKGCTINKQNLLVRTVSIKNVSVFIFDEIKKDIISQQNINQEFIVPLRGCSSDDEGVYILSDYIKNGSLASLLHKDGHKEGPKEVEKKGSLDSKLKMRIAWEIAKIFEYFHSQDPPLVHGHLTPNNILFTNDFKVKISDLYLTSLKKLANLKFNYFNKSAYSAPEILSQKSGIAKSPTTQCDAYSYGIILWELFIDKRPFDGLSIREITQRVVEQKDRPKIPDNCSADIAQIIRGCWQDDAGMRPNFRTIKQIMENFHNLS